MSFFLRSAAAALLAVGAAAAGAGARAGAPLPAGASEPPPFSAFGLDLFRRLGAASPEENVIVSPLSAGLAVSMLANGAGGATLDGIFRALAMPVGLDSLNRAGAGLMEGLRSDDLEILVGSSVWAREGVPVLPSFLEAVRDAFSAEVASVDFGAPATVDRMNEWASRSTRGRIPTMVEAPLPRELVLFLANAVYFKGRWMNEFVPSATRDRPFHGVRGAVERPLMHRTAELPYLRGEGFGGVRLPYRGGRFAMYVLLPDSGVALGAVRERMGAGAWEGWMQGFAPRPVQLALPRFRLSTAADLVAPLSGMGMGDAFHRRRAGFSRMVDAEFLARRNVFVSEARQQVFVEVNEEGTEAAAVTGFEFQAVGTAGPPVPFIVDRPFLFAIRDDATGVLLFVGQVVDPAG